MIIVTSKKDIMSDKSKEIVRIVVQFFVTLLGTLFGINL